MASSAVAGKLLLTLMLCSCFVWISSILVVVSVEAKKHHHHNTDDHDDDHDQTGAGDKKKRDDFDFYYFVQQWPGSYCDTKSGCCFPKVGKPPKEFTIHGLWPNNNDGSYPTNCDPANSFKESIIADIEDHMEQDWGSLACPSSDSTNFWAHEWNKHGTCTEQFMDELQYFQAGLNLHNQHDILQFLHDAGITPNGGTYSYKSISSAIASGTGFEPGIECNVDASGTKQLYQIYLCVNKAGTTLIECPVLPKSRCSSDVVFPEFN